jgi:uncharacterized protein (DUF2147 family)
MKAHKMKPLRTITLSFSLLFMVLLSDVLYAQDSALGDWYTVDDDTGEVKSMVTLSLAEDGTMVGVITKVLHNTRVHNLCDKCEGDKKDKPVEGMQFIWGMQRTDDGEWEDGQLLDPESGTVYNGNFTVNDNPDELDVRGYVGFSLFGRSQTWQRSQVKSVL